MLFGLIQNRDRKHSVISGFKVLSGIEHPCELYPKDVFVIVTLTVVS